MPALSNNTLQLLSTIVIVIFAFTVIFVRLHAAKKPTSSKKILIPPFGMMTGFFMFVFPFMRIPFSYAIIAFLFGCIFSLPLIISSKMERVDRHVYLRRSPAFIIVLLVLLILRLALHTYIESFVTIPQTGSIFFILAFGMLLPWRIVMFIRYRKFLNESDTSLQSVTES